MQHQVAWHRAVQQIFGKSTRAGLVGRGLGKSGQPGHQVLRRHPRFHAEVNKTIRKEQLQALSGFSRQSQRLRKAIPWDHLQAHQLAKRLRGDATLLGRQKGT